LDADERSVIAALDAAPEQQLPEPVVEESPAVQEFPAVEQQVVEQPVVEQPVVEQPVADAGMGPTAVVEPAAVEVPLQPVVDAAKRAREDELLVEYAASKMGRASFAKSRNIQVGTIDGTFARARKRRVQWQILNDGRGGCEGRWWGASMHGEKAVMSG
jgi:hypothetical protein